jgi:hypothetical protein
MNRAAVLSHLRAAAAAHRRDPAKTPIKVTEHGLQRMVERGVTAEDLVRAFSAPKPNDVRESPNGDGRWEVRARTIDERTFTAVVVLEERPNTIVVTVIV